MNITKRLTALLLTAVILLSFSGCGRKNPASFSVRKEEAALSVSADTKNKALYVSEAKSKQKLITRSDMTELYFDRKNCTVSVYDTASGKLWSSLPKGDTDEKTSAVAVTVLVKGAEYTLSSQSDSVGFSSALYEERENGVTVNYTFKRTIEDGTKINIFLPVSYTLSDGALSVEADCSKLYGENHDSDVVVTRIDILPYFGSDRKGAEGDYLLLPDGCGLIVELSENPDKFKKISLPVYENGNTVAAFGMKNGDSAFAALIDEGDELACIESEKALSKSGYNRVYGSFEITPTSADEDDIYVCTDHYEGKIRLLYRFLSYGNADYTGMAGAVRELLIRNGYLLSETDKEKSAYPFNLSVIFRNRFVDSDGKHLSQTLTTWSQAQEMLDSLKAKGIDDINLRLKGVLKDEASKPEYTDKAGKRKELESLLSYAGASVRFCIDGALITSSSEKNAAVGVGGELVTADGRTFLAPDKTQESTGALISFMRENGVQGICVNDGGRYLYGDYTEERLCHRTEVADIISRQAGAVSSSGMLMVDTGNIYAVKYAGAVVNLPSSAAFQDRELCTRVPFVQTVLHGLIDYSCEPINAAKNSEKAFLRAVEYGAVPYYEWYGADLTSQEKADKSCYLNYISEAQSQYERAAGAFEDLRDARITEHYKVKKNVYYTCYDNSTGIYVNYNSKPVSVNGVTVGGMSFLRVN